MLRKMIIGAVALVALVAAPAAAEYDFSVNPGTVVVGGTISVSGEGCAHNDPVTISITQNASARAVGDAIELVVVDSDDTGAFNVDVTLPTNLGPGQYTVTATCTGSIVGSTTITIVAPTSPTTPGSGNIVRTGSDLNGLGLVGAGLLAAGGMVLIITKSRRHADA